MVITVASLAPQTGVMTKPVAGHTFESLSLQNLAARLVFKLVIFTEEAVAEGALEDAAPVFPDIAFALYARGLLQWTRAGMGGKALPPMAHPGFTVVAYGANHAQSCCELARVLHNAVAGLHHALHFSAFCTDWQALESGTEVAEGSVFLLPGALVTFHDGIARVFTQVDPGGISSDRLLTELLLFRLLPLPRFLLRHDLVREEKLAPGRPPVCAALPQDSRLSADADSFERLQNKIIYF